MGSSQGKGKRKRQAEATAGSQGRAEPTAGLQVIAAAQDDNVPEPTARDEHLQCRLTSEAQLHNNAGSLAPHTRQLSAAAQQWWPSPSLRHHTRSSSSSSSGGGTPACARPPSPCWWCGPICRSSPARFGRPGHRALHPSVDCLHRAHPKKSPQQPGGSRRPSSRGTSSWGPCCPGRGGSCKQMAPGSRL